MRLILGAFIVALLSALAGASDYEFYKGYYWREGKPYRLEYRTVCNGRSCYKQPYYAPVPYTPKAKATEYGAGGWREELSALARERLRWKLEYHRLQQEQRDFDDAVRGLGLEAEAAGLSAPYSVLSSVTTRSVPLTAQGATTYGYNLTQRSDPAVDLMRLYNEAAQLARNAQSLGSQATGDFASLVAQETAAQAEAAEREIEVRRILARGQAAREFLQALSEPEIRERESRLLLTPAGAETPETGDAADAKESPAALSLQVMQVVQSRCLPCHGSRTDSFTPDGGLDMTAFLRKPVDERNRILARLVTDDESKLMPRDPETGKGKPLTWDELSLFFAASGVE